MISWWWTVLAFFIGGISGVCAIALCSAGSSESEIKWQELNNKKEE